MALSLRPRRPIHQELQCLSLKLRSFSISHQLAGHKQALEHAHANLPEYPYGPSRWYKQSNFGLYGGLKISSGNNVSPKTETKTRRKWRPNVQMKRLYSHALERYVRVKVATRVLRTIDKSGGLDAYLVGEKPARIKELGMKGWALRCKVMATPWWQQRRIQQREEFGLVPLRTYEPEEKYDDDFNQYLVGMYGEKVFQGEGAKQALQELEEAEADYDKDGNRLTPDLIAYDDDDAAVPIEEAAAEDDEAVYVEAGRLQGQADFEYVSGKHKRRAIVKAKKAQNAAAREAHRARKAAEKGGMESGGLRANNLADHLAYQKRQDDLAEAGKVLAASDMAPAHESRPTL